MAAVVRRLHRSSHASCTRLLRTTTSATTSGGACLPAQESLPYCCNRDDEETASAASGSLRPSESRFMSSVNWGSFAIGRGFGAQSRGRYVSGFAQHWSVRHASTEAAATGLHFVEADTGDTVVQADVAAGGVDQVISAGTSSLGEVAAAAADCSAPTAALQHLIDFVHTQAGLPWWLSIAATTVAIRVMVLPVLIFQMKATARLSLMRPELERITNTIKESGYDPKVTEVNQKRMKELFALHKTNPFMPLMGAFVQAPLFISFFFAIRNMAEKVPSFKEGGALWFTDLTTADPYFILPVMSGLFTLATIELGAMDGMQGQPMIGKMKMFFRGFAVLIVPLTATFPKALFCYWLTTNMCSLIQTTVLRQPAVKRAVGIPDTAHLAAPVTPAAMANAVTLGSPPKRSRKKSKR